MLRDSMSHSGLHSYYIDNITEYGPFFSIPLDSIIENKNNIIQISVAAFFPDSIQNMSLISEISAGNKIIDWRGSDFKNFVNKPKEWQEVYLSVFLPDINIEEQNLTLKVGIWNNKKQSCFVDDFEIKTIKGNELIYGLLKDFDLPESARPGSVSKAKVR
jgi:hypothetical protein